MRDHPSFAATRPGALLGLGPVALAARAGTARAQQWPTRPIRILVGYPAGGANDLVARAIAAPLAEALGQNIVVENRTGAPPARSQRMSPSAPSRTAIRSP